ncbi:MAG: hypothetical protein IPN71_17140 [Fibrobacteres bacterium]|nr:hypothetical protein [Fibrobacterota bacterium]
MLAEGATIPFIARYRKERTGNMDETVVARKWTTDSPTSRNSLGLAAILKSIEEQGKLTPGAQGQDRILRAENGLEDIYLPHKPKRRTCAIIAREAGWALGSLVPGKQSKARSLRKNS